MSVRCHIIISLGEKKKNKKKLSTTLSSKQKLLSTEVKIDCLSYELKTTYKIASEMNSIF